MNNNNIPHIPYGNEGVDTLSTNPYIQQTEEYLERDAQPPLEGLPQPAINPNVNMPGINYSNTITDTRQGGWVEGGTVLTDTYYNVTDSGIVETHSYSHNDYEQRELRARQEYQRQLQGRGLHQTPPSNSGFSPYLSTNEPPKPSAEQLAQLRKRDHLVNLNSRLKTLVHERQVASLKLASIDRNIKSLEQELEELS